MNKSVPLVILSTIFSASELAAQSAAGIICGGFEPMVEVRVTNKTVLIDRLDGSLRKAKIIGNLRGLHTRDMIAYRTWSKEWGIGYLMIRRAANCSEADTDPNWGLVEFIYADKSGVMDGCCTKTPFE